MAELLTDQRILSPEDIDRVFISHFVEEMKLDSQGHPYGEIDLGGVRVKVHPYSRSLRFKQDVAGTESTYPGIFITSMQYVEDTSKPNSNDQYRILDTENRFVRTHNQEIWYKFTYQVVSAALSYIEDRRLAYAVHNLFPKRYGSRVIKIGQYFREILITDIMRDDLLEDGIFRTTTTFSFSLPLLQDAGEIQEMVDQTEITVTHADDSELTTIIYEVNNV